MYIYIYNYIHIDIYDMLANDKAILTLLCALKASPAVTGQ